MGAGSEAECQTTKEFLILMLEAIFQERRVQIKRAKIKEEASNFFSRQYPQKDFCTTYAEEKNRCHIFQVLKRQ